MFSRSVDVATTVPVSEVCNLKKVTYDENIHAVCEHHLQLKTMQCNGDSKHCNVKLNQTDKSCRVFVGDLDLEVTSEKLRQEFAPFGLIIDCKVIKDPQTAASKGYGFVTFANRKDAETALSDMNGKMIGKRVIKTNWAIRKHFIPAMSYSAICNQTGSEARTIYCGGVMTGLNDNVLSDIFRTFGPIENVRCFADKGYGFVRFRSKEDAAAAILSTHLRKINGHTARCSWSKRSISSGTPASSTADSTYSTFPVDSSPADLTTVNHQTTNTYGPSSAGLSAPVTANPTIVCCCQQCQSLTSWSSYCSGCPACPVLSCPSMVISSPVAPALIAPPGPPGYVLNWLPVLPVLPAQSSSMVNYYHSLEHPGYVYTLQQC